MSNTAPDTIDSETGEVIKIQDAAAFASQHDSALLDVQVSTAKAYPRSIQRFQSDLEAWCTLNRETALECFFMMPRDGKQVIGPSVRFAELVLAAYTNVVVDTQVIEEGRKFVSVVATCRDLERNVASRAPVRRSIEGRGGKRFSQSMVETTIMAATAIARRNAIFQTVPKALWSPMYEAARRVAHGNEQDFKSRRNNVTKGLRDAGCDMTNVKAFLGGKDSKDLSKDEVLILEIKLKEIESNEITVDRAFPAPKKDHDEPGVSAEKASEAIAKARDVTPEIDPESETETEGDPIHDEEPPEDFDGGEGE